ncbi:MAG: cytochrome P450 [Solirubrobacteraceae bacterium]
MSGPRRSLPPGPRTPAVMQTAQLWSRAFVYLEAQRHRYGPLFTVRAPGHPPLVFVCDPESIRDIFAEPERDLRPGVGAAAVCPIIGEQSFMLAHGAHHGIPRAALVAALSPKAVQRHSAMVEAVTRRSIATWPVARRFAIHDRLRAMTLEIALRLLLGQVEDAELPSGIWELHGAILAMLSVTSSPVLTEAYLRSHGPGRRIWRRFLEDRTTLDGMLYQLIEDRAANPRRGLIDVLVALRNPDGSPSTPRQVRDNVMSILLAGHETTAAQLTWAFQLLAHNPTVQRRLSAELAHGPGEQYLDATVKEVLRHRCVFVFGIPRELAATVSVAGQHVAPPAQLLPGIYLLHHDPARFAEPQNFAPERFLNATSVKDWLPWGGGRRRCPGAHLATHEIKHVLRAVISAYAVEPGSRTLEPPRWRSVIVTPRAGGRVILRRR